MVPFELLLFFLLRKVKLMFFNKTEDDIIWRSQLEKLAFKDKRYKCGISSVFKYSYRFSQLIPCLLWLEFLTDQETPSNKNNH